MSNQPPYGYTPPGGEGYPPPGGGYGGGYPPPPGGPSGKTKMLGLDYNIAAMICYLLAVCCCLNVVVSILWLVTEPKENRFLRFHALQALLLFGVWCIIWIVFSILGVGMAFNPIDTARAAGSGIINLLYIISWAALVVLHIVCAVKAYQNQMWKVPVLGDVAEKNS